MASSAEKWEKWDSPTQSPNRRACCTLCDMASLDALNWSITSEDAEDVLSVRKEGSDTVSENPSGGMGMQLRCVPAPCVCLSRALPH